jgi:acyl-CoA synthetase (AMP-forming)/AMP-acid ligase II
MAVSLNWREPGVGAWKNGQTDNREHGIVKLPLKTLGTITDWRTGESWDRGQTLDYAHRLATVLRDQGAGPGAKALICHGGDAHFFGDLFAVWLTGACAVCLNPKLTHDELANIDAFVEPVALLVEAGQSVPSELAARTLDSRARADAVAGGITDTVSENLAVVPGDDALILFTSGTTGTPKGVVHSFRSILTRVALNQQFIPGEMLARTLCVLPTHFGHGLIGNCLTPLLAGHDLVLAPASNLDVTATLGAIIDNHRITFMSSVPTLWKRVTKSTPPPSDGTLRRIQVGSAPLSADLWQGIAAWTGVRDVVNMYGITETANWLAGASLADHDAEDGLIGHMWGGTAALLDASGDVVHEGEGEILVQTPSLMTSYYKQPDATAEVVKDGWYHTGDIGRIDGDGTMRLTGRAKYEINRGGMKIHPEDIDLLLERHDAIREACAFAIADEVDGDSVAVAVSLVDGSDVDTRGLRRWCAKRISREKVPVKWFVLDEVPKTDRGKLNRAAVAAHCLKLEQRS